MGLHETLPIVRPDLDLEIRPDPGGLIVAQAGRAYLARGWRLTPEVRAIIEAALAAGLTCMIQHRHPQASSHLPSGNGADYLTFSDAFDHAWVFVLDMDSCPRRARPTQVKWSKRYKHVLRAAGVACSPEWKSPQELDVALADLPRALEATQPWWRRLGAKPGLAAERGRHDAFVDEEDLHSHLVQGWATTALAAHLELIGSKVLLGAIAKREGEVDLLARDRAGHVWVIELKNRAVANGGGETPDQQLLRYMTHPKVLALADGSGGPLQGMLIAQEMDFGLRAAVHASPHPMVALEATKAGAGVALQQVGRSATSSWK